MSRYVSITEYTGVDSSLIKDDMKFKTGNAVWRIKFNLSLDPKTVNHSNLNVVNSSNVPIKVTISYNPTTNEIELSPLEAYKEKEEYILNISTNVKSTSGRNLTAPISVKFKI